ncbi:MAG: hypothetical protein LUD68_09310 [Rikenellaceae bacterium]|nr:hypothetical protein [Rikenellaceae bacterium]
MAGKWVRVVFIRSTVLLNPKNRYHVEDMNAKRIPLFLIAHVVLFGSLALSQQKLKPDLKPYIDFAPDTVTYLETNFGSGGFHFYGDRPIQHLLEDLDLDVQTIVIDMGSFDHITWSFQLYVEPIEEVVDTEGKIGGYPISVQIKPLIRKEHGEIYAQLANGHTHRYARPFDESIRALIEPLTIAISHYNAPSDPDPRGEILGAYNFLDYGPDKIFQISIMPAGMGLLIRFFTNSGFRF